MKVVRQKAAKYWWVTASLNNPTHGWTWSWYFRDPTNKKQNLNWGGPEWIALAKYQIKKVIANEALEIVANTITNIGGEKVQAKVDSI